MSAPGGGNTHHFAAMLYTGQREASPSETHQMLTRCRQTARPAVIKASPCSSTGAHMCTKSVCRPSPARLPDTDHLRHTPYPEASRDVELIYAPIGFFDAAMLTSAPVKQRDGPRFVTLRTSRAAEPAMPSIAPRAHWPRLRQCRTGSTMLPRLPAGDIYSTDVKTDAHQPIWSIQQGLALAQQRRRLDCSLTCYHANDGFAAAFLAFSASRSLACASRLCRNEVSNSSTAPASAVCRHSSPCTSNDK